LECDFTQAAEAESLIGKVLPEKIYHLVGSFSNDYAADYPTNVLSSKNIFDGLLKHHAAARILLIGSAAEYGLIGSGDNPVSENHELRETTSAWSAVRKPPLNGATTSVRVRSLRTS